MLKDLIRMQAIDADSAAIVEALCLAVENQKGLYHCPVTGVLFVFADMTWAAMTQHQQQQQQQNVSTSAVSSNG